MLPRPKSTMGLAQLNKLVWLNVSTLNLLTQIGGRGIAINQCAIKIKKGRDCGPSGIASTSLTTLLYKFME